MSWLRRSWEWSAAFVDAVLLFYLHAVNPRYVVTLFLAGNVLQSVVHFAWTTSWNDFYTASGYWVTVTGFLVAISELYRARTSAEQIRAAVVKEGVRQRRRGSRYFVERSKMMLTLARTHIDGYEWRLAAVRLAEMIESINRVSAASQATDDRWTRLSADLRGWVTTFDAGVGGRKLTYDAVAWLTFVLAVEAELNRELATFDPNAEADDGA
ncbi:MAG: hypothetical protein ACRC33_25500 [Gemmataceae bacterium]